MPKKNIDYSKTIIYKIVCKDTSITDTYIGHTTDFSKRKTKHKSVCSNKNDIHNNFRVYQCINANGGWDNWSMIELEKYVAVDANDACKRERYFFELIKPTLNIALPAQTQEDKKQYNKSYYQNNIENFKEATKIRSEKVICECGCIVCKGSLNLHKTSKKHKSLLEKFNT